MANSYTKYPRAFIPATKCVLAHMPMSGNNKDILIGTSASAYESMVMANMVSSEEDFSYQRAEAVIRYRGNYEDILDSGANYVAWKNTNFGNKTFYAYITRLEYKNPNVTWIHIDVDVINTFIYDAKIGEQYVERMHTSSDNLYENLIPESISIGEGSYVFKDTKKENTWTIGDYVTAISYSDKDKVYESPNIYEYDGMITQWRIILASTPENIKSILDTLSWDVDQFRSLVASYAVPSFTINIGDIDGSGLLNSGAVAQSREVSGLNLTEGEGFPSYSGSDYVPKNWKLYNAPFCMSRVSNGVNVYLDTACEYYEGNQPKFTISSSLTQPVSAYIRPLGYKGSTSNNGEDALKLCDYPTLSLSESDYSGMVLSAVVGMLPTALGAVGGLFTGASNVSGKAESLKSVSDNLATRYDRPDLIHKVDYFKDQVQKDAPSGTSNKSAGMIALMMINNILSNAQPATNGSGAGVTASMFKDGTLELTYSKKMLRGDLAKKVDDFFSMYGYAIQDFSNIDLFSGRREYFNYYQTKDCNINVNIPTDYRKKIQDIFDNGVRFWYSTDNFGVYSDSVLSGNSLH